ncbi:hypothetical protein EsDP_00007409 [Epichloe bromicola]|uniref:Fido domain-containing protein n=1 Tax=Epichloe bromicola TaxID=79588 RepID=A0ABQ0D0I4_9HYPO
MSARSFHFLTALQVQRLMGLKVGPLQLTQPTNLESAVYSPLQHKHYGQDNIFQLAGILGEKIILNHAFQDGNKRAALVAVDMFLKMNGYELQKKVFSKDAVDQQLKSAHIAVATTEWNSEHLASLYQKVAKPLNRVTSEIQEYINDSTTG